MIVKSLKYNTINGMSSTVVYIIIYPVKWCAFNNPFPYLIFSMWNIKVSLIKNQDFGLIAEINRPISNEYFQSY